MKKNNLKLNKINHFIFHQANEFIIKSLQRKLEIPDSKIFIDMKNTGNTASSSIPIVLSKNFNEILPGKNILLVGFGGGLLRRRFAQLNLPMRISPESIANINNLLLI